MIYNVFTFWAMLIGHIHLHAIGPIVRPVD